MKHLAAKSLCFLALCIACTKDGPSFDAGPGLGFDEEVRDLDAQLALEIANIEARAPANGQGGCTGTALLSLSRAGTAVIHTKPAFAALVPGLEAGVVSADFERTDESGVIPIKFRTSGFPFDVLVRLPTSETELVSIDFELPEGGACGEAVDGGPMDGGPVDGGTPEAGPSDASSSSDAATDGGPAPDGA
ncbi:MAG: hypothetical protein MUE69_01990 [Myxococcota bacterium]|jgi:hypothetical protein|nr:hypothetical protein [Myxococcota bacterium]